MDIRQIGHRIKKLREAAKLTQEDAAGAAKIHTRALQRLEAGQGNPTLNTLLAVAGALNLNLTDLYSESQVPKPQAKKRSVQTSQPQFDPNWAEGARILNALAVAEPHRRLSALYLLTKDESYLDQLRALPAGPQLSQVLRKVP